LTTDGGLRKLVRKHIPDFHWQAVETGGTGQGIPDDNFCREGTEGWVEHKLTATMAVPLRAEQVGWIERRRRNGGRVFILIRRTHAGGPRLGPPVDDVWLFPGDAARGLLDHGLRSNSTYPLCIGSSGPAHWPWELIRSLLLNFDFLSL
jgi:hypothetical protein